MKWMSGAALLLAMTLSGAAGDADDVKTKRSDCAPDKSADALLEVAMPAGGMQSLAEAIHYPSEAKRDGLEGEVRLQVGIDAAGQVGEVSVLLPVRADLDSAAVRAIRAVPWKAARGADGLRPCTVVVPIRFTLSTDKKQ